MGPPDTKSVLARLNANKARGQKALLMWENLICRVRSWPLFDQQKFDLKGDRSVYGTHYKHIILAVLLFGLCTLLVLALNNPLYRTAEVLLARGTPAIAIVHEVEVKKLTGRGEKFVTTVSYHFQVKDKLISGQSTKNSSQPARISKGDVLAVLYDPSQPAVNGWRAALHRETAGVFGVILAFACLAPYCVFSTYRYVRWLWRA